PESLLPQQRSVPSCSVAQTCAKPTAICVTPLRPGTGVGCERESTPSPRTVVPPSWLASLAPQQRSVPSVTRAQDTSPPTAISTATAGGAASAFGERGETSTRAVALGGGG